MFHPSAPYLTSFPACFFNRGFSVSTSAGSWSALLVTCHYSWYCQVFASLIFILFVFSFCLHSSPHSTILPDWNIHVVLHTFMLLPFKPLPSCSLYHLSFKTFILFCLDVFSLDVCHTLYHHICALLFPDQYFLHMTLVMCMSNFAFFSSPFILLQSLSFFWSRISFCILLKLFTSKLCSLQCSLLWFPFIPCIESFSHLETSQIGFSRLCIWLNLCCHLLIVALFRFPSFNFTTLPCFWLSDFWRRSFRLAFFSHFLHYLAISYSTVYNLSPFANLSFTISFMTLLVL